MISLIPDLVEALLIQYDFDLGCDTAEQLVSRWQSNYTVEWLPLAVVEALYLGRYKAICVQQILIIWQRRGQPVYHFNSEFQNIITRNILTNLISQADTQNLEKQTTPSASESESPELSKAESPPSNPFEPKSTKVDRDPVEQISIQPAQYNIKHTDFYTKLKAFAEKSENMRSHISPPETSQPTQIPQAGESLED
ncbi:MAG: hypothetical protein WBA93_28280 [Microcoleaceae cyanobacterium]